MEFFLARRFYKSGGTKHRASSPAIRIATLGIAVGLAVMILTQGVVSGFQREVSGKITGMASHIEVMDVRSLGSPEGYSIDATPAFLKEMAAVPGVTHMQRVATKMGILKTEDDFLAIQMKGIGKEYDTAFIQSSIISGRLPRENEILISATQAQTLSLKKGDKVFAYFFEDDIRMRRFAICGIYETHMALFDKNVVIASFPTVAALNPWGEEHPEACTCIEVFLDNRKNIPAVHPYIQEIAQRHTNNAAQAVSIEEHYPQVFSWLNLLDINMLLILALMVAVSGITMVSGLLILILERTQTIGILKALGASNAKVRRTFLYFAGMIVLRGMIYGNILALGITFAQKRWGFIKLDPQTYYVDAVPVDFHIMPFLLINVVTLTVTMLALLIPSLLVSRIQPAKAIRFE